MAIHHLPHQATSFVGREPEIAHIMARLNLPTCRLLTLVGMGGSGKTRLAIEAAERLNETFPDGVWFVPLQPLQFANQVVAAILDALPLQVSSEPYQQLLNYLREKHLLLILDNFEHLLDSAHLVSEILASAAHVNILVTSREALNLQEEWVQLIEGMAYPDKPAIAIEQYDAVRMFSERAGQVRHTFSLDQELESVLQICRLVEGLPLALELAAGWTKALSCQAIADELKRSSSILTSERRNIPARHSSIRIVLEHSWQRLDDDERAVFRRLSVFRGGFTREAAEQVAGASLIILGRLVDQSLINRNADGRYTMHELLRQYAAEQLEAAGETDLVYDAHSEYFLDFVAQRDGINYGPNLITHLDEVERDFDNIRAAWYRAVANRNADAISRVVECLTWFCNRRGRFVEHKEMYTLALARFAPAPGEEPTLVWAQLMARHIMMLRHDDSHDARARFRALLETSLEVVRRHDNLFETAYTHFRLGDYLVTTGNLDAITPLEYSLALFQQLGNEFYISECWYWMACHHRNLHDLERFLHYAKLAIALKLRIEDHNGAGWAYMELSVTNYDYGYDADAEVSAHHALQLWEEIRSPLSVLMGWSQQAFRMYQKGDFDESRRLAAETIHYAANDSSFYGQASATDLMIRMDCIVAEDYPQALRLWEQQTSRIFVEKRDPLPLIVFCGLEQYAETQKRLAVFLNECVGRRYFAEVASFMPLAAIVLANQGKEVLAVELFGLTFAQPLAYIGWVQRWPLVTRLLAHLKSTLGIDVYESAWERGTQLDVFTAAAELGVRFEAAVRGSSQPLIDSLTEREQDVLRLLAQGRSNREIAETLIIAVGTVKGYVYNICQKLGAQNRTQAIIRARQQGLLS